MLSKNLGAESFRSWLGIVEDVDDPKMLGRIKVRIFNVHSDDTTQSTDDLPWATPMLPVTSASYHGIGTSPTGIDKKSLAFGFFLDSRAAQMPVYVGTIPFIDENKDEKHSVAQLARGKNSIKKDPLGPEPKSAYAAKYPTNKVITTTSGHAIELDDTPGAERIHIYHRKGSYVEVNQDGRVVVKSANDSFFIVDGNHTVYIKGDVNTHITGNASITVDGNLTLKVTGNVVSSASNWTHTGNVNITGNVHVTGNTDFDGHVTSTDDFVAQGVSLYNHVHDGIEPGDGTSNPPVT